MYGTTDRIIRPKSMKSTDLMNPIMQVRSARLTHH